MSRTAQGLWAWLLQRVSAVYLGIYLIAVPLIALLGEPLDYQRWRAWLGAPGMGIATALFALAVGVHAWLGVREVFIDYVHPVWLRLLLLAASALVLLGSLLWMLRALTVAAMGGGA